MKYEKAKIFSNGTEYEIFRDNYCEHGCIHHKERDDGFTEFLQRGGCPIENLLEDARWDKQLFPNVLLEVWDDEKCLNWHHCPFYTAYDPDKVVKQLEEEIMPSTQAIEALESTPEYERLKERDRAKRPDLEGDGYDPDGNMVYDTWSCPNCETKYEVDYDDHDFCPKCGQRIDWSEEEEHEN